MLFVMGFGVVVWLLLPMLVCFVFLSIGIIVLE